MYPAGAAAHADTTRCPKKCSSTEVPSVFVCVAAGAVADVVELPDAFAWPPTGADGFTPRTTTATMSVAFVHAPDGNNVEAVYHGLMQP